MPPNSLIFEKSFKLQINPRDAVTCQRIGNKILVPEGTWVNPIEQNVPLTSWRSKELNRSVLSNKIFTYEHKSIDLFAYYVVFIPRNY
jgi:hypothetical protein